MLDHAYVPVIIAAKGKETSHALQTRFAYQVVFYEQPNPKKLQFLALDPLELDISSNDIPVITLNKKQMDVQNHIKTIIDYSHKLNGKTKSDSDELSLVLIQV